MQGFATRLGTLHMTFMSRWMKRINQWHLFIRVPFFRILVKCVACLMLWIPINFTSHLQSWDDISLTLETVTPTMGLTIPKLEPWTLSEYRPRPAWRSVRQPLKQRKTSVIEKAGIAEVDEEVDEDEDMGFGLFDDDAPAAPMTRRAMRITSKGDINATFIVPGLISVPSDGETHNVTVCELALNAVMSWVSVPKSSLKAHLTVCILVPVNFPTHTNDWGRPR